MRMRRELGLNSHMEWTQLIPVTFVQIDPPQPFTIAMSHPVGCTLRGFLTQTFPNRTVATFVPTKPRKLTISRSTGYRKRGTRGMGRTTTTRLRRGTPVNPSKGNHNEK